jgi:HEAT repeat protein
LALELLSSEDEEKAISTIVQALQDRSPKVRGLALELLGEAEGLIPVDQIAKIITNDPNLEQRMEAIVVLASRDEEAAHAILQNALNDSDPEVVELAKSILQDVDSDFEYEDLE